MIPSRLLILACAASATAQPMTFTVSETAGLRRFGYPVTASLECASGSLTSVEKARLTDAAGKEAPAQFTAMSKWPDGSVRGLDAGKKGSGVNGTGHGGVSERTAVQFDARRHGGFRDCSSPGPRNRQRVTAACAWDHSMSFAASFLAFASTSASDTGLPPWRALSSAASMKVKISRVSASLTGGVPVRKNAPIWRHRAS